MLPFLVLFTAVFSEEFIHKTHDHHEFLEEISFQPVIETKHKILKGDGKELPETLILEFRYDDLDFLLNLTQTVVKDPTFFDRDFMIHYSVHPKYSHVNDYPIDYGSIMFVDGKVSETFEGALSYDGASFSFKPAHREPEFAEAEAAVIGTSRRFRESRRRLDEIEVFENCWPGHGTMTKEVEIGYVVDPDFVEVAMADRAGDNCEDGLSDAECIKQKVTAAVMKINAETNTIYRAQFGVILKLGQIIDQGGIFDEQMTQEFPLGCETWNKQQDNILPYLQTLAAWRSQFKRQTFGVWKLLTNCFPPPGTIGIAYLSQLCKDAGVGVTTWTGDRTWLTDAHEIGHIFGAEHSFEEGQGRTGGIMDYGDGKLNGVFQFNRKFRKLDVCGTISESMTAPRVPNCWKTLSLDAQDRYDWEKRTEQNGGTLGECKPARGTERYRTTEYVCEKNGAEEVADELCDLGNKPIFNFATHQFTQDGCAAVTTQVCGDGNIEPGEECEKALTSDPDCCINCQWSTSAECKYKVNTVDAAFVKDSRLYLFKRNEVFKYTQSGNSVFDTNTPDEGFPRLTMDAFPGLINSPSYATMDAALSIPGSNLVYFFSGLNYVVYDMETNTITEGQSITNQVDRDFASCGKVDAAIGFDTEMFVFCGVLMNFVPYGNPYISHNVVHDLDLNFPESVMTNIDAAAHDAVNSETIFFNGGHETRWRARNSIGNAKQMSGLGDGGDSTMKGCPNLCTRCDPDNRQICQECDSGYTLSAIGLCIGDNVFASLDFNVQSDSDAKHIKGGKETMNDLMAGGKYKQGLSSSSPLDDEMGLYFNGADQLEMEPLNREWTSGLKITAYFKPLNVAFETQKFLSLTDGNEEKLAISFGARQECSPPEGCSCIESGNIAAQCQYNPNFQSAYCVVNPDCPTAFQSQGLNVVECGGLTCSNYVPGSVQNTKFELQIKLPMTSFNCFVEVPLQADKWNALKFEFSDTIFTTGVNGLVHRQAYENVGGDVNNHFQIRDWSIGATVGGILGTVDHFQLAIGESSHLSLSGGDEEESDNGGAIAAGVLVPLFFIGLCVLAYFYRDEINEWVTEKKNQRAQKKQMGTPSQVQMDYTIAQERTYEQEGKTRGLGVNRQTTGRLSFDISKSKNEEWYYANNDETTGPMSRSKLIDQLDINVFPDTFVWNPDMPEWITAGESEFASHFEGGTTVMTDPMPTTADVLWNYVGAGNENIGPIKESELLKLGLPGDTYVWNGTTVNQWTFFRDTYLSHHLE